MDLLPCGVFRYALDESGDADRLSARAQDTMGTTVNVDTILTSEYASATPDGRLTVVNAFNQLNGPGPKWGIPILYLTMVAHAPRREAGKEWDGEIRLIDANREPVMDEPLP
jgi:hypothetical protein